MSAIPVPLHALQPGKGRAAAAAGAQAGEPAGSHAAAAPGPPSSPPGSPGGSNATPSSPSSPDPQLAPNPATAANQQAQKLARQQRLALKVAHAGSRPVAHAAGDPGDTISDFQFSPATITVKVGDTVTWTNNGPTEHSATDPGVFDTGLLKKGQSGSHTFTQAGTFKYICSIHPFMHGTIVVAGSSSSTSSGSASGSSGSGSSGSGSTGSGSSNSGTGSSTGTSTTGSTGASNGSSAQTLPNTGLDLVWTLVTGGALIGAGVMLRHRRRAQ